MSLHTQLQGIAAFVHTVETGSFTAAAIRLGVAKSATGKSVARMEARLGVRLLSRTTRSLSPTPEGQAFYESCRRVLEELDSAEAMLVSGTRTVSGIVRINLPVSFGRLHCMPVLAALATEHPGLALDVSFADRRIDLAEDGIDLVVRLGDPGDQTSVVGRRIGWQRSVICASPDYLARCGRPEAIADLAHHDCLAFAREGRALPWTVLDDDDAPHVLNLRPRHVVSHGEALRDAALGGLGVAYLTTWLVGDDLCRGRLIALPIRTPAEDSPISVLWPRSRNLTPKVRAVVDALVAAFTPAPAWDQPR